MTQLILLRKELYAELEIGKWGLILQISNDTSFEKKILQWTTSKIFANFDFWENELEFVIKKGLFGCLNDDGAEFLFEMGCMFQKR